MPHREPKTTGDFEALSITPRGKIIRSRHRTEDRAQKRLDGVRRHDGHKIIDHRPRDIHGDLISTHV